MSTIQDVTQKMVARMEARVEQENNKDVLVLRIDVGDHMGPIAREYLESHIGKLWSYNFKQDPIGGIFIVDIEFGMVDHERP